MYGQSLNVLQYIFRGHAHWLISHVKLMINLKQQKSAPSKVSHFIIILQCITDSYPSLEALHLLESHGGRKVRIIDSVASQWVELAKAMGFGEEDIDRIRNTFCLNHEACQEMFIKWLEGDEHLISPVTWGTLIQCLIDSGLVDVADNLKEILEDQVELSTTKIKSGENNMV